MNTHRWAVAAKVLLKAVEPVAVADLAQKACGEGVLVARMMW